MKFISISSNKTLMYRRDKWLNLFSRTLQSNLKVGNNLAPSEIRTKYRFAKECLFSPGTYQTTTPFKSRKKRYVNKTRQIKLSK